MQHFFQFTSFFSWIILAVGTGVGAVGLWFLARWSLRWTLAVIAAIIIVIGFVLSRAYPQARDSLGDAPGFVRDGFWPLATLLALAVLFSLFLLIRSFVAARAASTDGPADDEPAGGYPDIDAAWQEIGIRLAQAKVDPADRHVYLAISPRPDAAQTLIRAAGVQLFARAPEAESPIHAYATPDGILLDCAGASSLGSRDVEGARRLEYACRKVAELIPDAPPVRGVIVLLPLSWAGEPDSVDWSAAVRDDLLAIERALKIRCPVFALVAEMETAPGFGEFLHRLSEGLRQSRCGFAVPGSSEFGGDLAQRGLLWMSRWFQGWTLSLMVENLLDPACNAQLFTLGNEFRRYRKRLRTILETAFSTPRAGDPVMFRGCYFAATGADPADQAFAAGLLRGPRGKIVAAHADTRWTDEAIDDDRWYRGAALGIGLAGGALSLLGWFVILRENEDRPIWWAGVAVLVVAWAVATFRIARR